MEATTFDGISRNLGSVSTRRSFARLIGGAAVLGAALASGEEGQARGKRNGKGREQVSAQGKKKKITICYQNQTRTVKKKGYQDKYPGATKGACPTTGGNSGGGTQPAQTCTAYVLSGGPNQKDPIVIDDDGSILNVTSGKFLLIDTNGMAGPLNPIFDPGQLGDKLRLRGTDWGGCRSFSPLWVHCVNTGQKRQIFTGYSGAGCSYPKGEFLDITVTLEI